MDSSSLRAPGIGSPNASSPRSPPEAQRPDPLRPLNPQAARFEDEKRRIMSTCFAKRDEKGRLVQSYITHIRVEEDAAYPSSPPPPDSNPQYKKPRAIILAVTAVGRVSMHKARENDDGSFQIGKTWGLEELDSIESFSNTLPKTPAEQQRADWAGPTGFLINMSKPYYWSAKSAKEKEFFIGSLVKVYNKFTGGKTPKLLGFDQRDKDLIVGSLKPSGGSNARPAPFQGQSPIGPQLSPKPSPSPARPNIGPHPPGSSYSERTFVGSERRPSSNSSAQEFGSRKGSATDASPQKSPTVAGPRPFQTYQSIPPAPSPAFTSPSQSRNMTPHLSSRPSRENGLRQPAPQQYIDSVRGAGVVESSRVTPQGSQSAFLESSSYASQNQSSERFKDQQSSASAPVASSDSTPLSSSTVNRWQPTGETAGRANGESLQGDQESASAQKNEVPTLNGAANRLPERRRPPLQDPMYNEDDHATRQSSNNNRRPQTPVGPDTDALSSTERSTTPKPPGAFISAAATPPRAPAEPKDDQSTVKNNITQGNSENNGDSQEVPAETTPQYRPGLGPMTGRKAEVANKFRKAATAHRAFVPRAGGAGDRMFGKSKQSNENEPDGITGVVPARSAARNLSQDSVPEQAPPELPKVEEKSISPTPLSIPAQPQEAQPLRVVDGSNIETIQDAALQVPSLSREDSHDEMPKPLVVQKPQRLSDRVKAKRKVNPFANALLLLGVDPALGQDQRTTKFEENLTDFGWERNFLQRAKFDQLQARMRKEVSRIEGGSWLGHSDHKDERVDAFEKSIDKAIAAVDDMEGLLTLYSVELSTLNDDVAYIEAQSQGLQVQTANQKLLHSELENLVSTVSLDSRQLEPLRNASLAEPDGQEAIEAALSLLYKAIQKIDPKALTRTSALGANSLDQSHGMRALQERKEQYMNQTREFLFRLKQYVDPTFDAAFKRTRDALQRASTSSRHGARAHDEARSQLWRYNAILLFVKELDMLCWKDLLKVYQSRARELYQEEIRESISEWKKRGRQTLSEEQESLFSTQEKEHEGLAITARKMTVKRSATLAKSLRQASHEKRSAASKSQDADLTSATAFAGVLSDLMPAISAEQNFVTDFFHATGFENLEFVDAVLLERPEDRHIPDLVTKRPHDPDRTMANAVNQAMDAIFASWSIETHNLLEWAIAQGPFQAIGVLACLERARINYDDTNQEYLVKNVQRQRDFLLHKFEPFVSEQINAIENVKIKTNKRRGIMSFTRVFPLFIITTENMIPQFHDGGENPIPDTRKLIDDAYTRIANTVFKALDSIARETTLGVSVNASATDPEDKGALNAMIMLIENNHHLFTEIEAGRNSALMDCQRRAERSMLSHRERYVAAVIRRPLGRLLDFLDQVENDRRTAGMATHSRSAFKKILSNYDAKNVRRDIDALKKRVEKHFSGAEGGAEDHTNSTIGGQNKLTIEVLEVCEKQWIEILERAEAVCKNIYEGELAMEYTKQDVSAAFRR